LKGGEDPSNSMPILKKIINLNALDTDEEHESDDEPLIDRRFSPTPKALIHTGSPDIGSYHSQTEVSLTPSPDQVPINSGSPSIGSYNSQEQEALRQAQEHQTQESELIRRIRHAQRQDEEVMELINEVQYNPNEEYTMDHGVLLFKGSVMVPDNAEIKKDILNLCHDQPLAGHFGILKTYDLVKRSFYWHGMKSYIKKYVTSCDTCQRNKTSRHRPYGLLQSLSIPKHPWS